MDGVSYVFAIILRFVANTKTQSKNDFKGSLCLVTSSLTVALLK